MDNSDNPRDSRRKALFIDTAVASKRDYGTPPEEDKWENSENDRDPRIFGVGVPRKMIGQPSAEPEQSSKLENPLIQEQSSSELQKPTSVWEPSSSSCVTVKLSPSKKRLPVNAFKEEGTRSFKKLGTVPSLESVPPTQTSPPAWLVNVMMREENACDLKLIIQKEISKIDIDKRRIRFSIPFNQVLNTFLTEKETRIIDEQAMKKNNKEGVKVVLVGSLINGHVVDLSRDLECFFLGGWKPVVAAYKFKVGDVFHLWTFRYGQGKLCFALVPSSQATYFSHVGGSGAEETCHGTNLLQLSPTTSSRYAGVSTAGATGDRKFLQLSPTTNSSYAGVSTAGATGDRKLLQLSPTTNSSYAGVSTAGATGDTKLLQLFPTISINTSHVGGSTAGETGNETNLLQRFPMINSSHVGGSTAGETGHGTNFLQLFPTINSSHVGDPTTGETGNGTNLLQISSSSSHVGGSTAEETGDGNGKLLQLFPKIPET